LIAVCLIGSATAALGADTPFYSSDDHFFHEFWEISTEVERIGQMAQTQSQDAQVIALGEKLVQDYAQAGQLEANLAQGLGVGETYQMSDSVVSKLKDLANLSGVQFDRAAVRELSKCEEAGANQLELEISNSGNLAVRQLAAVLQAALVPDLQQTEQLDADLNGNVSF